MALREKKELIRYLQLLDEPFGLIVFGEINNMIDNDILDVPREKEELIEKKRMSILPRTSLTYKNNISKSFAEKIEQTLGNTLSKNYS